MALYKTEITSEIIPSDNPIHQRLLKPYGVVAQWVKGDLLELGCGEGRGLPLLLPNARSYLGLDKINSVIRRLSSSYKDANFKSIDFPPLHSIENNSFDSVVSFQVIEHLKNDRLFLNEIYRVLRPGGTAYITTPNREMTLSRNPWHIREYTAEELLSMISEIFDRVEMKGIAGNEKVMRYYEKNKRSVEKIMQYDLFDLQYKLPAFLLKIPYELMNRVNRNRLSHSDDSLAQSIHYSDYQVSDEPLSSLDLFVIVHKE